MFTWGPGLERVFTTAAEWCGVESEVAAGEGVVCSKHGMRCWGLCAVTGSGGQSNCRAGLIHEDSQVLGRTGTAAAAAQPAGADGGKVGATDF